MMRSFEERKAEIFRRSEKRIREQRHRRRILLSCVPLFLCVLLAAIFVLPGRGTNESADRESQRAEAAENASGPIASVHVEALGQAGASWEIGDEKAVRALSRLFESAQERSEEPSFPPDSSLAQADRIGDFRITCVPESGEPVSCLLENETLYFEGSGKTAVLTVEEQAELARILQLPQ